MLHTACCVQVHRLLIPHPSVYRPNCTAALQDPILRYGGMFVTGLAYCGTSNNAAIQKLLHFAVSGARLACLQVCMLAPKSRLSWPQLTPMGQNSVS